MTIRMSINVHIIVSLSNIFLAESSYMPPWNFHILENHVSVDVLNKNEKNWSHNFGLGTADVSVNQKNCVCLQSNTSGKENGDGLDSINEEEMFDDKTDWNNSNISPETIRGKAEDFQKIHDEEFMFRTKRWVIIVDDEESIRLAIGDYLFDQGYQVTACADADALLQVCSTPSMVEGSSRRELPPIPDAIVSDIRMPGKDGIELLRLIRAQERLSRVPVILLTAKTLTQDRILGYKAGADAYLTKPFAPEELLVIIDTFIRRKIEMTGPNGNLLDLRTDMLNMKEILRQNGEKLVKETDVYLTPTEQEVLALLCKGYSNGEIAKERGGISIVGINRMIQKLYLKTQTRSRTELVRWAIQTCYVPRP